MQRLCAYCQMPLPPRVKPPGCPRARSGGIKYHAECARAAKAAWTRKWGREHCTPSERSRRSWAKIPQLVRIERMKKVRSG